MQEIVRTKDNSRNKGKEKTNVKKKGSTERELLRDIKRGSKERKRNNKRPKKDETSERAKEFRNLTNHSD